MFKVPLPPSKAPAPVVDEEVARHVALAETREALDDPGNLQRRIERLPAAIKLNAELRLRHADDPERFLESEELLDQLLVDLHALGAQPSLLQTSLVPHLLGLLEHENGDVVGRVVSLLRDTTELDEACSPADYQSMLAWATALVETGGLERLLIAVKGAHAQTDDHGEDLGFQAMEVLENLLELEEDLLLENKATGSWIDWLLAGALGGRQPLAQFAAELLVCLGQARSSLLPSKTTMAIMDGLLGAVAPFTQLDPREGEETEWLENLIDLICLLLLQIEGREAFAACEGFRLIGLMLGRLNWLRGRALKLLDYAVIGQEDGAIEAGLLACLGPILMEKGFKQLERKYSGFSAREETCRLISILASLWRSCSPENQARLLAKFHGEAEKRDRLVLLGDALANSTDEEGQYAALQLDSILINFPEIRSRVRGRITANMAEYDEAEQNRLKGLMED